MIGVSLKGSYSTKSLQLVSNKTCQIQILDLANSDLNEKGRQLPAGQSFFVNFWSTAPYSLEGVLIKQYQRHQIHQHHKYYIKIWST